MIKNIIFVLIGTAVFSAQAMDKTESFREINSQLQNSKTPDISVIVELQSRFDVNASEDQALRQSESIKAGLMSKLSRVGAREHKHYKHLSIMAIQVGIKGLKELEKSSDVKKVYPNKLRKHSLRSSTVQVQADKAWARNHQGRRVTIAIVDAGFSNFTDMFNAPGKVVKEACFTTTINIQGFQLYGNCWPNNSEMRIGPDSAYGGCSPCAAGNDHGSLVAGVAAGNADQYSPKLKGVARESSVIAVNVFSRTADQRLCGSNGSCVVALDSDVLAGLDYVYSQRNQHDIAAVNLSLGGGAFQNSCDDSSVFTEVINRFKSSNIAVVVSVGNAGSGTSISEPACVSNAIAVGSVGDTNEVSFFTNSNHLVDFWAPGENITTDCGDYLNCYETVNGTSFSAPHVSGAFAILRSFNMKLTVDEILAVLKTSGIPIKDPLNGITRPLIQINNALDIAPRPTTITPITSLLLLDD